MTARLHGWAKVPNVTFVQSSIAAQVDEVQSSKVTDRPCLKLAIVKRIKGLTHDLRRTDEVVGSCDWHAEYET